MDTKNVKIEIDLNRGDKNATDNSGLFGRVSTNGT